VEYFFLLHVFRMPEFSLRHSLFIILSMAEVFIQCFTMRKKEKKTNKTPKVAT